MNRVLVVAAVALALSATTVTAAPPCTTDPRGDVKLNGVGAPVADAPHLDLLRLNVLRTRSHVVAVFYTAGGIGNGEWKMHFDFGNRHWFRVAVRRDEGLPWAAGPPDPRRAPDPPVEATVNIVRTIGDGETTYDTVRVLGVTGEVTNGMVAVRLPLKELGVAAPRPGARGRVQWAAARQDPAIRLQYEDTVSCFP